MSDPLYLEALARLERLLDRARRTDLPEPRAMTVATADRQGRPSARTVLLRGLDERGLVFYTNLRSRKGRELEENPQAALCFYWPPLAEQVTVRGRVEPVSPEEADAYWVSRPKGSQIAAWASRQSETLPSRFTLLRRVVSQAARFRAAAEIPRPAFWSGFRVIPERFEFWSNRPSRLHERVCYEYREGAWARTLLYP